MLLIAGVNTPLPVGLGVLRRTSEAPDDNGIRPPLRLHVDNIDAKAMFLDDAVDSFIAAATDRSTRITQCAPYPIPARSRITTRSKNAGNGSCWVMTFLPEVGQETVNFLCLFLDS
jgi:hypothetical protein